MVRRLKSGKLLLVKYGLAIDSCTGRSNLSAWLSDDDGITWEGGLILDDRPGGVSYPDGVQVADGTIYITSDHDRGPSSVLLCGFAIVRPGFRFDC